MGALIVLDVHARDVVERLVNEGVSSVNDFAWICQMRYFYEESGQLSVRMVQASLPYGYEYLGNTLRLVITPLTAAAAYSPRLCPSRAAGWIPHDRHSAASATWSVYRAGCA